MVYMETKKNHLVIHQADGVHYVGIAYMVHRHLGYRNLVDMCVQRER